MSMVLWAVSLREDKQSSNDGELRCRVNTIHLMQPESLKGCVEMTYYGLETVLT